MWDISGEGASRLGVEYVMPAPEAYLVKEGGNINGDLKASSPLNPIKHSVASSTNSWFSLPSVAFSWIKIEDTYTTDPPLTFH
jgi:hypothetical protein